jgi:hypothetical protein
MSLLACGGGGSNMAGGVGSGGTGLAEGAVSGFGSVIVAGVEYDDSNAGVYGEDAQGQPNVTEAKLGQRVRIRQSQTGVADTIQVMPQLIGPARSAADANGVFTLLGQTVRIISNGDTQNTATVLDGLSGVNGGEELEVHGQWVYDNTRGYSVLIATRIEKLSTTADPVLVSGVVRQLNNNVITLDNATGQTLQASALPAALAAQSLVTAWVPRSALTTSPWAATRVVDASPGVSGFGSLVLSTQISDFNLAKGEIRVQGMPVKLPANLLVSPPSVGATVQIEMTRVNGEYKAVTLTQRQNSNELGGSVEIKGSLLWPANPAQLSLRGNTVTIPNGALASNCARLQTNDSVYLEISAQRTGPSQALVATSVSCSLQIPVSSVLEVSGTLKQINTAGKTLDIQTPKGQLTFVWSNTTLLPNNLNNLLNRNVEVEYQTVSGQNRLRKLKPD